MRKRKNVMFRKRVWLLGALFLIPLTPTVTAEIYAWETDDGVVSYTDDPKSIPGRYEARSVALEDPKLDDYDRYTEQDPVAAEDYAAHLQRRLDRLRRINGIGGESRTAARAASSAAPNQETLSISTGGPHSPRIDVASDGGEGPLVVERVRGKDDGDTATRNYTVVTRGGKTVAVIKGRANQSNVNELADGASLVGE